MRGLWLGGLVWLLGAIPAIALPQPVRSAQPAQSPTDLPSKPAADRLLQQGIQQYRTGQFRAALQSWEAALQIYRALRSQSGEASALGNLGNAYNALGQYQRAIEYHEQSLALDRQRGNLQGVAQSIHNLGNAYQSLGDYQRAITYYEQSLAIERQLGNQSGLADSLGSLGNVYNRLGQYQRAITYYEQALEIDREIGNQRGISATLGSLGLAYQSLGSYQRALDYYEQSLVLNRQLSDRQGEAISLGSLGTIYNLLGQYQRSINYQEQALAIKREIGDRNGEAISLSNLGQIYNSLGQQQRSIDYQEQALAIKREIGDRNGEAISLNHLGNIYNNLGQHQQAINYYEQALAIQRAIGDQESEAVVLSSLGNSYYDLGQYQRAITYHEQSLAIKRKIGNQSGVAYSLTVLGMAYHALNQYQRAIEYYEQSLAIARAIGDREVAAMTFSNLGFANFYTNRLAESAKALQSSLDLLEAIQADLGQNDRDRTSLLETQQNVYQALQQTLIAMNQATEGVVVADRGRARSLLSFLQSNPESKNSSLTAAEMQSIAQQQKGTIIHYSAVWGELYIWVIPPQGAIAFRKVPLPESAKGLGQTAEALRNSAVTLRLISMRGNDQGLSDLANQLRGTGNERITENPTDLRQGYDLLIKPIADLLPTETGSKLIIIPHRELAVVPFAALRDESGKFLIDRHTLAFAPSVSVLAEAARRPQTSNGPALVVGNPNPMPDNLNPLQGAEAEARAIAQILNATPLIGAQATESQVKERIDRAGLLHFATHGVVPRTVDGGLESWLALVPGGNEDGRLTIAEIFDRNLQARLAVLSACDTGRGTVSGEGVIGLARAFLKAGVPTVVASLWKVPDEPTALMMQAFYAERAAGSDPAVALRSAMLQVREQYPGPQNWAAFVAIGDTN
ncbi:tetratricopeptide repeat protein [Limnothrix sp. FACHB-708]|uniref:CHAT domain-containing tetratricopeptide repeat protein n=1 Tax=unclassified Limnothrix TaxID=2632864 RepID=UPI001688469F|nr:MULTISPECIES: tetratricopeptide repeat protein [unclassified Limnothrix]MBD2554563.1 tetratricopeptide repeat protein [Limnothrix sp. FACHB-708]MBD2591589.1 tetratricopeptide repeat protein [Limnothrix sp. FACHB-406]